MVLSMSKRQSGSRFIALEEELSETIELSRERQETAQYKKRESYSSRFESPANAPVVSSWSERMSAMEFLVSSGTGGPLLLRRLLTLNDPLPLVTQPIQLPI